jgi:hypothetical protein
MAHGFNSDYDTDTEENELNIEEEELNQEVFIETGLPDTMLGNQIEPYISEGIPGILDGYNHKVLTLEELQNAMRHTLQSAGYTELCQQRIDSILNNYRFVIMNILNFSPYRYRGGEKFKILNNNIRLLSFKNRMCNYKRGILRYLVFRKGVGFRIILAIPPRHSCFGYTASQINFAHCVDAFPTYEYYNRIEKGVYEDINHSLPRNIGFYWWFLEFTLTQTDYLQFTDIFDILINHQDINLLYSTPIFSWRSALDDIASYINIIWNKHEEITGSPYTERKTSSQKNARHRKKNKRRLQANGISLVR